VECSEINDLIMKYLDGSISELELKLLDKHRLNCRECNEEFEMMTEIFKCINELPEISPPYNLEEKVMKRIRNQRALSSMASMLVGVAGLFAFAYYMMIFIILPFIQDISLVQQVSGYVYFAVDVVERYLINMVVHVPIIIENLLILRNILIKDYMHIMLFIAAGVMVLNIGLIRVINFQQE